MDENVNVTTAVDFVEEAAEAVDGAAEALYFRSAANGGVPMDAMLAGVLEREAEQLRRAAGILQDCTVAASPTATQEHELSSS